MNKSTQTDIQIKQEITPVIKLYNTLYLTIRKVKEDLTRWMDNLHNNQNEILNKIEILDKEQTGIVDDLMDEINELKDKVDNMKEELRDELIREMREEMRS